jgi:predicted MFS family arabinose efflux permease
LFAVATGVMFANVSAPQTLVEPMLSSLGLQPGLGGLFSTASLLGYALGLFFLVPLADLIENRALVTRMLVLAVIAALATAFGGHLVGLLAGGSGANIPSGLGAGVLFAALFVLGAACSGVQVLVPMAASMAAPEHRGRVIGDVMGGLLAGIVLSRPAASLFAQAWGWQSFFVFSAATLTLLIGVLRARLPVLRPPVHSGYGALVGSLWTLLREEPVLRRHALSAALVMAAFSMFWTTVALRLAQAPFDLGQRGIALFALFGAGGVIATPLFGRAGDRGWTRPMTTLAHLVLLASLALAAWGGRPHATPWAGLAGMALGAMLIDVGVTGDQTLGRRAINLLRPEARGRMNGLFVGIFFIGGAIGSALTGLVWIAGGWLATCGVAAGFGMLALLLGLTRPRAW